MVWQQGSHPTPRRTSYLPYIEVMHSLVVMVYLSIATQDVVGLFLLVAGANVLRSARRVGWVEFKAIVGDWVFSHVKGLPPVQRRLKVSEEI